MVDAFHQNYTTNVKILETRLKAARQQPGQEITTIFRNIRTLARRTLRDHPHLLEQIFVTSSIAGLNNSTLRWELRNLKHGFADFVLRKALELQAYQEFEGRNPCATASNSSAVSNHMTNHFLTENIFIFDDFVRSLERDTDNVTQNPN